MITSRVVPPALPDLHPAPQLADTVEPRVVVEKHRAARATSRGRSPPQDQPQAPPGLGRPSCARRADATPTPRATRPPPGHPGHRPALASPPGGQEVDLSEPLRSPAPRRHDRRAGRTDGPREPDLGLSAPPGRTTQARPSSRRIHHPPDPQGMPDTAGAAAINRHVMARVPGPGLDHASRVDFFTSTARSP
jgi:hypothetical protein